MNSFLWYLLEANAIMLLLYVAFRLTKKNLSLRAQRFFLVGIPLFSYGIVTLKSMFIQEPVLSIGIVTVDPVVIDSTTRSETISWWSSLALTDIYWIGVFLVLLFSVLRITKVFLRMAQNVKVKENGFTIVEVDAEDSFSFFKFIQIRKDLESEGRNLVLEHEKIHAEKLHSADVILLELYQSASWFNPLFIFMKKDLNELHEFEVDQVMYDRHKGEYLKFLLAYSLGINTPKHILTNQFYNSLTIKKRVQLMKTKTQKKWTALVALPALMIGLSLVSWTAIPPKGNTGYQNELRAVQVEEEPDEAASYPGGETAMMNFIMENTVYPEKAKVEGIEGIVYVQFIVERSGDLSGFKVVKGAHTVLDREALRVLKQMPNWEPGTKDGKKVATKFTIPIHYKLPPKEEKK